MKLEVGSEPFPGYRLQQIRGRGGFAEVWQARNPNGKQIALKFFTSNKITSTVKEVKSLTEIQKLSHPHLLRTDHIWSVPGYIVVAMELADGSLLELFDAYQAEYHTPIEPRLLCGYLMQSALALDFLNARNHLLDSKKVGWQHCDIKPSNILLIGETIKLADFGLSTPTTAMLNPYPRWGTLDFACPEVHRGILSERSDQYSLAITYYYLRTGDFPFPPMEGFRRSNSYQRPEPDLSLVTPPEQKVLRKALNMQPESRWESCVTLMNELESAMHFTSRSSPLTRTPVQSDTR